MILPESRIELEMIAKICPFLVADQFFRPFGAVVPGPRRPEPAVPADPDIGAAGRTEQAPSDRRIEGNGFSAFPAHGFYHTPFDQNRAMTYSGSMFSVYQGIPAAGLFDILRTSEFIHSIDFSGLEFSDADYSGKTFVGCRFSRSTFTRVRLDRCHFRMCFFDFARFSSCSLTGSDIQFSSFAGVQINDTSFENSDLLHDNFNGLLAGHTSFNDSDLYNSRFVMATLKDTSFQNCNLKKTMFLQTNRDKVSFKSSNTREAIFGKGENPE
jgi:hypothetical protein